MTYKHDFGVYKYVFRHGESNGSNFETIRKQGCQITYNRVAKSAYFSITFVINMIETWFWCPYLCLRAWEIVWEQFWNHPINGVATFGITGLPDHLFTHKQAPRRRFLAWLNAAQLVKYKVFKPHKRPFSSWIRRFIQRKGPQTDIKGSLPLIAVNNVVTLLTAIKDTLK